MIFLEIYHNFKEFTAKSCRVFYLALDTIKIRASKRSLFSQKCVTVTFFPSFYFRMAQQQILMTDFLLLVLQTGTFTNVKTEYTQW